MADARQSKALLKLGVATDLGTAVRTTSGGLPKKPSPEVKRKNHSDKLLRDLNKFMYPNKQVGLKMLDRILAEKIQKEIESQGGSGQAAGKRTGAKARAKVASPLPPLPLTPRREDEGYRQSSAKPTPLVRTPALEEEATLEGLGLASPPGTSTVTSRDGTANSPRSATAASGLVTADKSSEIDIVEADEASEEWARQAKPMVLNLVDPMESTVEVLEYEAERPLDLGIGEEDDDDREE